MDKLTAIKIKYDDGTYSDEIPVSVLAENVEWDSTHTLVDILGSIDVDVTGTIQDQISQLFNEKVSTSELNNYVASQLNKDVTNWLKQNVNPVGSAVIVDSDLTIQGAAADAKVVGNLKSAISTNNTPYFFHVTHQSGAYDVGTVLKAGEQYLVKTFIDSQTTARFNLSINNGESLLTNATAGRYYYIYPNSSGTTIHFYIDTNATFIIVIDKIDVLNQNDIIAKENFISGTYENNTFVGDSKRLCMASFCKAKKNAVIQSSMQDLYMYISVYNQPFGTQIYNSGWISTSETPLYLKDDGYVMILLANGADYATSTAINLDDINGKISIIANTIDIDSINNGLDSINNGLDSINAFEIDKTVTANESQYIDCLFEKGTMVEFKNLIGSSTITVNIGDGTSQKTITGSLSANNKVVFEAPFDIVSIRCFVAGTAFKVSAKRIPKAIYDIQQYLHYDRILPSYYASEIEDTVNKLKAACEEKSIVFALVTDSHTFYNNYDNWTSTVSSLSELNKKYPMDFIAHLGDITEGDTSKSISEERMLMTVSDISEITKAFFILTGNHDDNHVYYNNNSTGLITDSERYSVIHRCNDFYVSRTGINQYFYYDVPNDDINVRIVCLDGLLGDGYSTGGDGRSWGYTDEQVAWVRDVALNTNKQIVFLSHMALSSIYHSAYERGYTLTNSEKLLSVIKNFIDGGGTVIGWFNGHEHADFMAVNSIGIHEVQTGTQNLAVSETAGDKSYNDGAYTPNVPARSRNDITKELYDIVVVCPVSKKVKIIRFGAGNDRNFTY